MRAALATALALGLLALAVGGIRPAHAATINVNTFADELNTDGDCSLREAIRASNTDLAVDALKELRFVAQLSVSQNEPCPDIGDNVASIWGDVDCSGNVTSVDALKILRHVALLSVTQNDPCPDIGTPEGG